MTHLGELDRLTEEESADLNRRVQQFVAAWKADGAGLSRSLPPPGARHRSRVLVLIVIRDMECRAALGLHFRVERYINELPNDLSTNSVPVDLLVAEYQLRHRYTDKPALSEYQRWFPEQYDALVRCLQYDSGLVEATGVGHASPTPVSPVLLKPTIPTHINTLNDGRRPGEASGARLRGGAPGERDPNASALPSGLLPADAPYQLVRKLGSGAFGEVFEALAPGGVKVAVKRILRTLDHPASVSELEALEAIKLLSHPFLLKTNAFWPSDDKLVIVMELADGSLKDRIEHHRSRGLPGVPPEELVPFFEQAGEALDYLHSQSISHRDIKPENLLVMKGYAKVADFGLARLHEHNTTMMPTTAGTPAYMAPEMWQQRVSLQSDQYSLAATYVRARLGRHLYDTNILVDMANSHINGTPDLSPLPPEEQAVLLKALAKNPDDRHPSCLAFAKALRAAVMPPPAPPRPTNSPGDRKGNGILGTITIAASCAVACALAVGVVMRFMPAVATQPTAPEQTQTKTEGGGSSGIGQPPLPPLAQYPAGWNGDDAAGIVTLGNKRYHKRIVRQEAGEDIAALLVEKRNGSDPDTFYMMEYKITNKVFEAVWPKVNAAILSDLRRENKSFVPGRWRKDAEETRELRIDGPEGSLPVLGVTAPEAILVATELGGSLPTFHQWTKAAGLWEGNVSAGPAGPPLTEAEQALTFEQQQALFAKRKLALGLVNGPLPVADKLGGGDKSVPWNIRQLVSNGREWLCEDNQARPVIINPAPAAPTNARVVGHNWSESAILPPAVLRTKREQVPIETVTGDGYAGFRVVIKPE